MYKALALLPHPAINRAAAANLNEFQNTQILSAAKKINTLAPFYCADPRGKLKAILVEIYSRHRFDEQQLKSTSIRPYLSAAVTSFLRTNMLRSLDGKELYRNSTLIERIQSAIDVLLYWGSGKCDNYACFMLALLLNAGIRPVDLVYLPYDGISGHHIVVVGFDDKHTINEIDKTNAIVVDLWLAKIYPFGELTDPPVSGLPEYKGAPPIRNSRFETWQPTPFKLPIHNNNFRKCCRDLVDDATAAIVSNITSSNKDDSENVVKLNVDSDRERNIITMRQAHLELLREKRAADTIGSSWARYRLFRNKRELPIRDLSSDQIISVSTDKKSQGAKVEDNQIIALRHEVVRRYKEMGQFDSEACVSGSALTHITHPNHIRKACRY